MVLYPGSHQPSGTCSNDCGSCDYLRAQKEPVAPIVSDTFILRPEGFQPSRNDHVRPTHEERDVPNSNTRKLILFDVDGTLSKSRQSMQPNMYRKLESLKEAGYVLGVVGGSDREKQIEQIGAEGEKLFDYLFSENGLVFYQKGNLQKKTSLLDVIGETTYQKLVNFTLQKLSEIELPFKRGNFIELRTGLVNICPVGRSVTQVERDAFVAYDQVHKVRQNLVTILESEFGEIFKFSLGGQISIDAFPHGFDKTFCLSLINRDFFTHIYFFGDQVQPGGNDHEIFKHPHVIGNAVQNPEHTIQLLNEMFF